MATYAYINHLNLVTYVIEGVDGEIEGIDAAEWYGNLKNMKCVKAEDSVGVGMGYCRGKFIAKPHEGAGWDGNKWLPSLEVRIETLEKEVEDLRNKLGL